VVLYSTGELGLSHWVMLLGLVINLMVLYSTGEPG
jgi:hypothetical protein